MSNIGKGINRLLTKLQSPQIIAASLGALALGVGFAFLFSLIIFGTNQSQRQPTSNTTSTSGYFTDTFGEEHTLILEIADSVEERRNGLMFRTFLPANQGMLFVFDEISPQTFWMKNTLISLDIIYLDADGRVVNFYENTTPSQTTETYPSLVPVKYVLEVNSGWVQKTNLKIGDNFRFSF